MAAPPSRFRTDALWSAAGTLLPVLLGAATVPMLLLGLGAEKFSIFASCLAIISFAPTLDLGVSRATLRLTASLQHQPEAEICAAAGACLRRALWVGVALAVLLAVVIAWLLEPSGASNWKDARIPLMVATVGVPFAIVGNAQRSVLEGARLFSASAGTRIILGLLSAVVPLVLTAWTQRVEYLCASLVVLRMLLVMHQEGVLTRRRLSHGRWAWMLHRTASPGAAMAGNAFWTESLWYAVLSPVSLVMSGLDRFVIAWIGGLDAGRLAAFLAPQEIALRAIILPASIVPALLVRLAAQSATDASAVLLTRRLLFHVAPVVALACTAASLLAPTVGPRLFVGVDAATTVHVMQVLCIGVFSNAIAQFPMTLLSARGLVRDAAVMQIIQLPIYLACIAPLLSKFGVAGAAWAWSGRIVVDSAMLLWRADHRLPALSPGYWQLLHTTGVAALLALALAT